MPFAEASGRKIEYELFPPSRKKGEGSEGSDGGEERPPLLLINGMGGSCRGWIPLQVPEFSKTRPTLIYNHRGVMESDDSGEPFTTADLADDAARLLDALEIEQADVLGAFMGGMAAQELALRHPARVRKLTLLGTYARPDAKRRLLLADWAELARLDVRPEILVRSRLLWTLEDATLEQTELIDGMLRFYAQEKAPVSNDLFARQCDACLSHDTLDRLERISHPCLIICGRHDRLTPPSLHRELAAGIAHSRLVVLQYGAHLVVAESAETFHQVVQQFLESDEEA